ncbi:MAG: glycosyltransferase [Acidobacteriota bacterium]
MVKPVTVLMAVYNSPLGMLDAAIDSILGQTFRDFEFLIVDDGSSDTDVRDHLAWRSKKDARIVVAWEPHRGLTGSLNRGMALAQGAFIARQDADDWSAPHRLERQWTHLMLHPTDALCGSNVWTHQQNGSSLWCTRLPQTHSAILAAFAASNPFVHGSVFFRKSAALDVGGYCEVFRCSQDYDFFWRLAERHPVANLGEPLYHYRYTAGSVSARRAADQMTAHDAIRMLAETREHGGSMQPSAALAAAVREAGNARDLSRALLKQADHLMLAGHYRQAGRSYVELLRHSPRNLLGWGKLARLGLFQTFPSLREASFR